MFPKLPTHLRPFLGRIPSHTSPDLFTPNPSLLHHLPQNGSSSHTLVSQAQSSAQAAGNAGSAGRAGGYSGGSSAGSGGGYTGHARAFASLQQSTADPSAGIESSNNDDNATTRRKRQHRRESISFRPPYHRPITVIDESVSLSARLKALTAAGPAERPIQVVDLDGTFSSPHRLGWKESGSVDTTPMTLAPSLPEAAAYDGATGSPDVVAGLTSTRRPLTRSRSTLELYQVGMPSRPLSSARQYSTAASPAISELDLDIDADQRPQFVSRRSGLPPIQRKLSQPNRVLMDLAGLDIPPTRSRSYATVSSQQAITDERVDYASSTAVDAEDNEMDRRIYIAIVHAIDQGRKDLVRQLIDYYRSPRDSDTHIHELASHLPLPAGYTVNTYNVCIKGLLSTRSAGESIAPILEIYNEMLQRDIVPNGRTYADVIVALCAREKDVQSAVARGEEGRKWAAFRRRNFGLKTHPSDIEGRLEDDATIRSYLTEGNLNSAYRLFKGIASLQSKSNSSGDTGFYRFYPVVYNYILDAMSVQRVKPDSVVSRAYEVFEHCNQTDTSGRRLLYKPVFRILANASDAPGVLALWERFEAERAEGMGTKLREWKDVLPGADVEEREKQVEAFQAQVWTAAAVALIETGSTAKAVEVLEMMMSRLGTNSRSVALSEPPRPTAETFGAVIIALAEQGHFELSKQWYDRAVGALEGTPLRYVDVARYIDALVLAGQWRLAMEVYLPTLQNKQAEIRADHVRIKRIYGSLLGSARQASNEAEAVEMLSHVDSLMATDSILIEPELAVQHIRILLKYARYGEIASVIDRFGPMMTRFEKEDRAPLYRVMEEVAASPIGLTDILEVLRALARQRIHPILETQALIQSVIEKYLSVRSTEPQVLQQITADGWFRLTQVISRTVGQPLDEGDHDVALEAVMSDLGSYSPKVLEGDVEGRITRALSERIFNRFGSDRATAMLTPLLGEASTTKTLAQFFRPDEPTTPDLTSDGSTSASDLSNSPIIGTPPADTPSSQRSTSTTTTKSRSGLSLRIDAGFSRRLDSHADRNPQMTAASAYIELRSALSKGIAPHPVSLGRLMTTFAREGGAEQEPRVLELYQLGQTIVAAQSAHAQAEHWRSLEDAMLISQCHMGHLEQAGLHRHRLVEAGIPPSADAYATMIASSKDTTDDALVARELFDESQMMGVTPHLYLYNTVISKLSKARKAEMALEMFARMKAQKVRPSSVTYGAVINACCRVGDAESAETLFNEMTSQPNFRPRVPPFNTMMQFYLQTRPDRERVLYYHRALLDSGVASSAHTYKLLLDAYHTLAPVDLTAMERTFADLCADRTVKVQGTHWASLITAYGISAGDVDKALEVFDIIPTHPSTVRSRSTPTAEPVVWEAILNVPAAKGTLEQLESMRSRMTTASPTVRPTAYVYNVLIQGYARHGRIDSAREVFESMSDSFIGVAAPNNHPTLHTSSGHVKPSTTDFAATATEGAGVGVYREPSTYEVMIRAELQAGEQGRAEEILARMEERRYPIAVYLKVRALVENAGAGVGVGASAGGVPYGQGGLVYQPRQQGEEGSTTAAAAT